MATIETDFYLKEHICGIENFKRCAYCELDYENIIKNRDLISNDEFSTTIKAKISSSNELFEGVKNSFDSRVHESVSHAKNEIDIRVESVKIELDRIRDFLFDDLDQQSELLKKSFETKKLEKFENYIESSDIDRLIELLKNSIENIQQYMNVSFKVKFEESLANIDDLNLLGKINYELNKILPSSNWEYICDDYDMKKYRYLLTLEHTSDIRDIRFVGDGNRLASCSEDATVSVWDAKEGTCLASFDFDSDILINLGDEKFAASSNNKKGLTIWNLNTLSHQFNETIGKITCLELLKDELIACGSDLTSRNHEYIIEIWKIAGLTLEYQSKILNAHEKLIFCLTKIDDTRFASSSVNRDIKIWDMSSYTLISKFKPREDCISCIKYVPMVDLLVCGSKNKKISVYDYKTHDLINSIDETGEIDAIMQIDEDKVAAFIYENETNSCLLNIYAVRNNFKRCNSLKIEHLYGENTLEESINIDFNETFKKFSIADSNKIKLFDFKSKPMNNQQKEN